MQNRFIIDLGTVKLSAKNAQIMQSAIQRAALSTLAELDFKGDIVARFPREWLGLWIDISKNLAIKDAMYKKITNQTT